MSLIQKGGYNADRTKTYSDERQIRPVGTGTHDWNSATGLL